MKEKFSISEIKNFLKKKGFVIKKKQQSNYGSLSRTFLTSLIIILIFFVTPLVIDVTKKSTIISKENENILKKLTKNENSKLDAEINNNFVFDDVLQLEEQPTDTVRLSASTIEELFQSTNYNLDDVRKNKLVKPIALTFLPEEIKQIENIKKKERFVYSNYFTISD